MALDFLKLSPTYVRTTDPTILHRREIVTKHLNDKYKMPRNGDTLEKIRAELAQEGIEISESSFQADKVIVRTAFIFLNSSPEEQEVIQRQAHGSYVGRGINCLLKDGIRSWSDIPPKQSPLPEEFPAEEVAIEPVAVVSPTNLLRESILQVEDAAKVVIEDNDKLREEIRNLREINNLFEEEVVILQKLLTDTKNRLQIAHSANLESLAKQHPDVQEIQLAIKKLRGECVENHSEHTENFVELKSLLPEKFVWKKETGSVIPTKPFLEALSHLQGSDHDRVLRGVRILAEQGSEYPSLRTEKMYQEIPHTPRTNAFESRASDELRFTWVKLPGRVVLHWMYRKGETRIRQSER